MTQFQYDAITRCIVNGAPAMSEELCRAFADVVQVYNECQSKKFDETESKEEK